MASNAQPSALNEWAIPHYREVRRLRLGVLILGGLVGLVLASVDAPNLLRDTALVSGVFVCAVSTGITLLPGFKSFQKWTMTAIALLDMGAIGLFMLLPEVQVVGAVIVLMPAMWLGGTLGRPGIVVAAAASAALVAAPELLAHGIPEQGLAQAAATILFATLSAAGLTVSNEMWTKQVLLLEQQSDDLRRAISVKDDFIALVSHELRTPLTSIIGYLDLVADRDDAIPDEARRHLDAVSRNADRLLLLVTDLLSAHAAESAPMRLTLETVDVSALASLSVDDAHQRATESGLMLVRDLPPGLVISADPSRVLQVLDNLLSNAIKFTPPGGRIYVTARQRRSGVDLEVADTGVGVDKLSLEHLGTKFYRAPSTTAAAVPGIGLGLMITRAIIDAHHGSLTFTSQEGLGTSVLVHLPTGGVLAPVVRPDSQTLAIHPLPTVTGPALRAATSA